MSTKGSTIFVEQNFFSVFHKAFKKSCSRCDRKFSGSGRRDRSLKIPAAKIKLPSLSVRFLCQGSCGAHLNMPINKCQHISPAQRKIFGWRQSVATVQTVTCSGSSVVLVTFKGLELFELLKQTKNWVRKHLKMNALYLDHIVYYSTAIKVLSDGRGGC